MSRRHVAATNRFVCTGEFLWKSLSLQQNFVAATSRTDSVWFDFLRLVAATKFCCGDKDFHKNSPVHTKRFVAATCRFTLLLQLVARPVHMEWYVASTCCCSLSPSMYRPLPISSREELSIACSFWLIVFNSLRNEFKTDLQTSCILRHKTGALNARQSCCEP